jgi:hypothetical protein
MIKECHDFLYREPTFSVFLSIDVKHYEPDTNVFAFLDLIRKNKKKTNKCSWKITCRIPWRSSNKSLTFRNAFRKLSDRKAYNSGLMHDELYARAWDMICKAILRWVSAVKSCLLFNTKII